MQFLETIEITVIGRKVENREIDKEENHRSGISSENEPAPFVVRKAPLVFEYLGNRRLLAEVGFGIPLILLKLLEQNRRERRPAGFISRSL